MKKNLTYLLALTLAAATTACQSDDTDFSAYTNGNKGGTGETTEETIVPMDIAIDESDLDEPAETFSADDNDYVENSTFSHQVNIHFDGTEATVTGDVENLTVNKSGAHVTITSTQKDMAYTLSGATNDGSLKVYSENKYKLELNGVKIANPTGAAINNQGNKTLYVVLAEGTENTLTDGTTYTSTGNEDQRGTLFSEGQMVFSGKGKLIVLAHCKNGIASDDYIRFRPGCKVYVNSTVNNGVKAKDGLIVGGGVLNIEVRGNGAKGLNCDKHVEILGGRTTIITTGNAIVEDADTTSCAGIKCDSTFTMRAGTVSIKSSGDGGKGVNANMNLYFTGGKLNVVTLGTKGLSSPKGIKSDMDISISGGGIYSYSANSNPLDAKGSLTVAPGYATYTNKERLVEIAY